MQYKYVDIKCYCGNVHSNLPVGIPFTCDCGIVLHTQQKKGGTGMVRGTVKDKNAQKRLEKFIQSGESMLCARFFD